MPACRPIDVSQAWWIVRLLSYVQLCHIALLHRQDFIVMKLFAGRPRDLTDIVALRPTPQELQFARSELPRLRRIDEPRATRLESFLDQYHDDGH
jgi:hypothetical protein